jgi:hypothetical protein
VRRLLALLVLGLLVASPAGAASRYSSFDNFKVGDCQYETAANLVLSRWPRARITTAEVVAAYDRYGSGATPDGLWAGQDYLLDHGFGGHRAASITLLGPELAGVVSAANAGGVEVANLGPVREHMFAIVAATPTTVTVVDDGPVVRESWLFFLWSTTQDGESLAFYAVTW